IVERPAMARYLGAGAECRHGVVGGFGGGRDGDDFERRAAPQPADEMSEHRFAAKRSQNLARQTVRVEPRLDDRADSHQARAGNFASPPRRSASMSATSRWTRAPAVKSG